MATNYQMRAILGCDRTGGKKGPRVACRLASSKSEEALDALKALRDIGQTEISAINAAKILGGGPKRFSNMVNRGHLKQGAKELMTLDSLISWTAKGVAQAASRRSIDHGLDWLREG